MRRLAPNPRLGLCLALLAGCEVHACGAPPLAVVTKVEGAVTLAAAATPARWSAADVDAELAMGDAIRTGDRSRARLALDDGSLIHLEPNSTLRLLHEAPGDESPTIDVLAGGVVISTDDGADVATRGGRARLAAGSRVELRRIDERLELTLILGRARLAHHGAGDVELTQGETVAIERPADATEGAPFATLAPAIETSGGVLVTRPAEDEGAGEEVALPDTVGDDAPRDDALDHADFSVAAGGGVVVRDTGPPTAIRLVFRDACAAGALVERLRGRHGGRAEAAGRGTTSVSLAFPAGTHRYQVRCLVEEEPRGRPVARGRVQVIRSSGQAPLPRSAPESRVDADGRTYTILYQNHVPSITARWPGGAPGPATLVVRSRGATRRVAVRGPEHRFAPGLLGNGVHSFHFEAASGGRRSPETSVRVRFDETAASAHLAEPATGSFAPGETVRVSGIALAGWRVVAADREIPIGHDQRFAGEVVVPASGALVVKVSKPGQGVHYYVRRARAGAGAP